MGEGSLHLRELYYGGDGFILGASMTRGRVHKVFIRNCHYEPETYAEVEESPLGPEKTAI